MYYHVALQYIFSLHNLQFLELFTPGLRQTLAWRAGLRQGGDVVVGVVEKCRVQGV